MKRPHLLHVEEGPDVFAPLLSAMAAEGARTIRRMTPAEPRMRPTTVIGASRCSIQSGQIPR